MAPFDGVLHLIPRDFNSSTAPEQFSAQWAMPGDVFSILLIVGGGVIGRALAQLAGSRFPFVAFSFGWVAYAVSTVLAALGENKLMPGSDYQCKVINGESGYVRDNTSWIIGRIVRDFPFWMRRGSNRAMGGAKIQTRLNQVINEKWTLAKAKKETKEKSGAVPDSTPISRPIQAGLCVSVYEAAEAGKKPLNHGLLDCLGVVTAIVQLSVAAAPWIKSGDWSVFLVTAVGTTLAFLTGLLPQWAQEKWACREKTTKTVILTRGNGSQHAIVIIGCGRGLDLEDLAAGPRDHASAPAPWTRAFTSGLALVWILLLIAAAGIKENTWFLLGVGGLGMLENLYEAGKNRLPESFGVSLVFKEVIAEPKVMATLFAVEEKYPRVGRSMLGTFFPGRMRDEEVRMWDEYEIKAEKIEDAKNGPEDSS
ncbi:hypothetical protein QQS21_002857 [Conoideocrella luteorostrata]|uniref:Uncharacterized protein n=1 Tax=Conoideocrella luteorostrata TaxID=1105319 RepID=A0AAJ0FWX6_9HYPO|nr:hypothetical protein QQS21_002857 [Conoideocrella luteorostrata]